MRVPLSWLREFVDHGLSVDDLAAKLTMIGLEVDAIERIGVAGSELPWPADKVLVCNILEVLQHPNADKLVLADVDYGGPQPHRVVTGAPNIQQYKGLGPIGRPLKSVFAREGTELYDGHADGKVKAVLKGRPVRGVMSDAMLCSEKELGMSDEHEGILLLPDDAPVGAPLAEYLGETVLELSVLPNMARCLSILGVAREVAAITGAALRMPDDALETEGPSIDGRVMVTIETPELCPRFTAGLIEGVTVGQSPFWMQRRLTLAGMRPISNIVDISNYVMLELGAPNHMFDADAVADRHLVVRQPRAGEALTTLDGKRHALSPDELLVADGSGPLSLAGVMGGLASEVAATTTNVLVESAIWEPTIIRRMSTALKARSEASRRFERGVDYGLPPLVQRRLLGLLRAIAGGQVAAGIVDAYPTPWREVVLDLTPGEVRRLLGLELTAAQVAGLLLPLGFGCELIDGAVRVTVPSARRDVTQLADLCEEVARMYGYDRLPQTLLADALPEQRPNPTLELEQKSRDVLSGAGLAEAITYSLTSMAEVATIDERAADPAAYLKLANPLSSDREYMRRSLLPTLLDALGRNLRERERAALFEIGRVYLRADGQVLPDEPRRLAIAMAGPRAAQSWQQAAGEPLDFFDLKGVVETLLERLNLTGRVQFAALSDDRRFQPGRAATLLAPARPVVDAVAPAAQKGKGRAEIVLEPIGVIGELHPDARARLGIAAPRALAAEIDLDALIALATQSRYAAISRFPAVVQDLAVVVAHDTPQERVAAAIRKYAGGALESLTLFDVYSGAQLGDDKRSLGYRLSLRLPDRMLSEDEVAKIRQKIVKGIGFDAGGTIRS